MSLVKKLFRGSIAQSIQILVGTAVGLFMLPFMINQLGESLYGIWILIGGFTATLYLFDFGFATAVTRFMARNINQRDDKAANQTINSALVIYSGLALLVLAVTAIIVWISPVWIENPENIGLVRNLIFLAGLSLAIEFPFKAFAGIATAYIRYDLTAWCRIVIRLISTGVAVWALLEGYKLLAIALIQLGTSMVGNVVLVIIAYHLHKPLRLGVSFIDKPTMRSLLSYSSWAFVIDVSRIAKDKAPIFLVGAYLGTSMLTVFYVAVRLSDYSLQFLTKATGMSTPVFAGYQARGDMDGLKNKLVVFIRLNFLLGFFALYSFILLGEPLIRLWMGDEFAYQQAYAALIILLVGKITDFIFAPMSSLLYAVSRHRLQALLDIFEVTATFGIISVGLAMTDLGLTFVAAGFALPFLITRALVLPWFVHYEIEYSPWRIYRELLKPLVSVLVAFAAAYCVSYYAPATSLESLIILGALTTLLYWLCAYLTLKDEELGYLIKMLPDRVGRVILSRRAKPATTLGK